MIVGLLIMEIILAVLIIFTTYMISYKFKSIESSLEIYSSSRAYKTQSHIAFIEKVMNRYNECINNIDDLIDIESIIKTILYREKIGRFSFTAIRNIALKSTRVMWGITLLEVAVAFINKEIHQVPTILIITTSILVAIVTQMFKFIKSIDDQSDMLIMLVQDYILNIYPVEVKKKTANREIIKLRSRINELEKELKADDAIESSLSENNKPEKTSKDELSIQDIAKLIGIFQ
jgi:hypothetical protein